jgi:hypothetical protein
MQEEDTLLEKNENHLKKKNLFMQFLLEIAAIFFWIYAITKLFIYDVDLLIVRTFLPNAAWIVELKFFFIIGVLATIWLFTKSKTILITILYVLFYPIIVLVWKIPKVLIKRKSWIGAFTFIGIVLSFFKSLKLNTIALALFLIPLAIIWRCNHPFMLWTAASLVCVFICFLFSRAFYFAFKPSLLFKVQSSVLSKIWENFKNQCSPDKEIKGLSIAQMTEKQLQQWSGALQNAIILNRTCYFLTTKLRDFQRSRINVFYYVTNFFFLVLFTIISFAVVNFAVYKIEPSSFSIGFAPRFFHFIYYSTNTLFTNSIVDFNPTSTLVRTLATVEVVFGFVLLVILFFLVTTVQSNRHTEEIDLVIKNMRLQGDTLEHFIREEYRLTIDQAIQELEKIKAGLMKVIYYLSSNIDMGH